MANKADTGLVVAIDGPAGAGKSTVSRRVAQELGYQLLDTGAIYRAVAFLAQRAGADWQDGQAVAQVAEGLDVEFQWDGEQNRIVVDGEDLSGGIRTPDISQGASIVSSHPPVRAALLELQRRLGSCGGVVAEGRDIGTVVFPEAHAKFFLTASDSVRARRRFDELSGKGAAPESVESTLAEIRQRDRRDTSRQVAPLARADDAVLVDSSTMDIDQVVATIVDTVRRRETA